MTSPMRPSLFPHPRAPGPLPGPLRLLSRLPIPEKGLRVWVLLN